jgi:hypothetical protein
MAHNFKKGDNCYLVLNNSRIKIESIVTSAGANSIVAGGYKFNADNFEGTHGKIYTSKLAYSESLEIESLRFEVNNLFCDIVFQSEKEKVLKVYKFLSELL